MATVKRGAVTAPVVPMETVDVPSIGGEVIVRGLLLKDRLALATRDEQEPFARVSQMLEVCVLADDKAPLWTAAQWEQFGASNFSEALRLFDIAQRLSGMHAESAEKK